MLRALFPLILISCTAAGAATGEGSASSTDDQPIEVDVLVTVEMPDPVPQPTVMYLTSGVLDGEEVACMDNLGDGAGYVPTGLCCPEGWYEAGGRVEDTVRSVVCVYEGV